MYENITSKRNAVLAGRGAAAIYAILRSNMKGKKVLLPCNICYAAVYPVIFSGNIPVFCDIAPDGSGNVNISVIEAALMRDDISAAVIPHMFGNPVADIEMTARLFKERGILFIEDCASAMGAEVSGKKTGDFGDYAVFSTGYSKTVDIGNGGLVMSDRDLSDIQGILDSLPLFTDEVEANNAQFSSKYRKYRNNINDISVSDDFLRYCAEYPEGNFLYRLDEPFYESLSKAVADINGVYELRCSKLQKYESLIAYSEVYQRYDYNDGAVPWRFNLFVSEKYRAEIIRRLLSERVPVSDWYPVVTELFSVKNTFENGAALERRILNFPLLIPDEEIGRIVDTLLNIETELKKCDC